MSIELAYYNTAATICGKVYLEIKSKILLEFIENKVEKMDILPLLEYGNERIKQETNSVYKKIKDKGIASPTSISLNNCVGNYIYDYTNKDNLNNFIKVDDIIKINLGVTLNGCIANLCETFLIKPNEPINKIIDFLDSLQESIIDTIGESNDDTRILIESECTNNDVFPIQNCTSYEQKPGLVKFDECKYIILNHTKHYDRNEELIGLENLCFEYLENEVYTIDLSVTSTLDDTPIKYKKDDSVHLYRFNEYHYSLKFKSARGFFNETKQKYNNYYFDINPYKNIKNSFGIRETLKSGILEESPIIYATQNKNVIPVVTKRFTLMITNDNCKLLKYNL